MANQEVKIIESRLGRREIRLDKIIFFPRGIIGFEDMHEFILLQIQENAPLLVLQSIEKSSLGLLVADPFVFMPEYTLHIGDAEQKLLQAENAEELAVLVTASIPPGKPEETALNLLGPILINHRAHLGLQVPQIDMGGPARMFVRSKMLES